MGAFRTISLSPKSFLNTTNVVLWPASIQDYYSITPSINDTLLLPQIKDILHIGHVCELLRKQDLRTKEVAALAA
jgi:hypothetical protein